MRFRRSHVPTTQPPFQPVVSMLRASCYTNTSKITYRRHIHIESGGRKHGSHGGRSAGVEAASSHQHSFIHLAHSGKYSCTQPIGMCKQQHIDTFPLCQLTHKSHIFSHTHNHPPTPYPPSSIQLHYITTTTPRQQQTNRARFYYYDLRIRSAPTTVSLI